MRKRFIKGIGILLQAELFFWIMILIIAGLVQLVSYIS